MDENKVKNANKKKTGFAARIEDAMRLAQENQKEKYRTNYSVPFHNRSKDFICRLIPQKRKFQLLSILKPNTKNPTQKAK